MNSLALNTNSIATNLQRANAYTSSSSTSTKSDSSDSSTVTSADFLTLLVTQLKNQDPTQPTDPTAYVQQLVGVNSLEQLIDVNKQLTSLGGTLTTQTDTTTGASSTTPTA